MSVGPAYDIHGSIFFDLERELTTWQSCEVWEKSGTFQAGWG
jgi:hypothetical protein